MRVRGRIELAAGDGVVFEGDRLAGEEVGGRIFQIEQDQQRITGTVPPGICDLVFASQSLAPQQLYAGQLFWKTDDPRLNKRLRQSFASGPQGRPRPLAIDVRVEVGQPIQVTARLEGQTVADVTDEFVPPVARKHAVSEAVIREQLGRLGGSAFELGTLEARISGDPMVPLSVWGRLRRQLVEQATATVESPRPREIRVDAWRRLVTPHDPRVKESQDRPTEETSGVGRVVVLCRTLEQLEEAASWGRVEDLECDLQDIREYRKAVEMIRAQRLWLAPPRITKPKEIGIAKRVLSYGPYGILARNLAHIDLCRSAGMPFITDFSLNAANEITVATLLDRGAERVTVSYDLNRDQLKSLVTRCPADRLEIVIHQHMPMFHMEHCVFCALLSPGTNKTNCGRPCDVHDVKLRDRTGVEHPLKADVGCRNTLFNATAQSGAEVVHDLQQRGVRHFRVELLDADRSETRKILEVYARLLDGSITGTDVWKQLQVSNRIGVTRGTLESKRDPLAIL
ncbi:MAG: DUF3656 domain-containing protein [Pirellulaceae bacterium]